MIQAILFDLDGTLTDTLPLYIKSYNRALKKQHINLTIREIVDICFGKTVEVACAKLGIPEKTEEFLNSYLEGVKTHFKEGKLFEGVTECLNLAKEKQIKLAVISFAYNWYVKEMIKRLQLNKYFDKVIGFNDITKAKPDPEAVTLVCRKFGIQPSKAIVLGDAKSDIIMGKSAGCKTVLFYPREYKSFYDLEDLKESNPDKIIKNFKNLKEIIIKNTLC